MPIFFREYGKGFPVVLLHGLCETHEIWNNFSSQLADLSKTRVICPDLPGFGDSEILPDGFSISDVARHMSAWLSSLKIKRCLLVGHSLGGYVALAMARERPDLARGLMLFNSTAYADTEEKRQNRDKVIAFVNQNGVQPYVDTFVPGLFYQKEHPQKDDVHKIASKTGLPTLTGYLIAMRDRPDQTRLLKTFQWPFSILAGKFDTILPISTLKEQAGWTSKAYFFIMERTGHMAMIEEPMESLKALNSFIAEVANQAG